MRIEVRLLTPVPWHWQVNIPGIGLTYLLTRGTDRRSDRRGDGLTVRGREIRILRSVNRTHSTTTSLRHRIKYMARIRPSKPDGEGDNHVTRTGEKYRESASPADPSVTSGKRATNRREPQELVTGVNFKTLRVDDRRRESATVGGSMSYRPTGTRHLRPVETGGPNGRHNNPSMPIAVTSQSDTPVTARRQVSRNPGSIMTGVREIYRSTVGPNRDRTFRRLTTSGDVPQETLRGREGPALVDYPDGPTDATQGDNPLMEVGWFGARRSPPTGRPQDREATTTPQPLIFADAPEGNGGPSDLASEREVDSDQDPTDQPDGDLDRGNGPSGDPVSRATDSASQVRGASPEFDRLVDRVYDAFERKLRIERERRGL